MVLIGQEKCLKCIYSTKLTPSQSIKRNIDFIWLIFHRGEDFELGFFSATFYDPGLRRIAGFGGGRQMRAWSFEKIQTVGYSNFCVSYWCSRFSRFSNWLWTASMKWGTWFRPLVQKKKHALMWLLSSILQTKFKSRPSFSWSVQNGAFGGCYQSLLHCLTRPIARLSTCLACLLSTFHIVVMWSVEWTIVHPRKLGTLKILMPV